MPSEMINWPIIFLAGGFIVTIGGVLVATGIILGQVRRHARILNGNTIGALTARLDVAENRLDTHAEDYRYLRAALKDLEKEKDESIRRIWEKIGGASG